MGSCSRLYGREAVCFGHRKGNEVSEGPGNHMVVSGETALFFVRCTDDTGYIAGDRGFLGNDTFHGRRWLRLR